MLKGRDGDEFQELTAIGRSFAATPTGEGLLS